MANHIFHSLLLQLLPALLMVLSCFPHTVLSHASIVLILYPTYPPLSPWSHLHGSATGRKRALNRRALGQLDHNKVGERMYVPLRCRASLPWQSQKNSNDVNDCLLSYAAASVRGHSRAHSTMQY